MIFTQTAPNAKLLFLDWFVQVDQRQDFYERSSSRKKYVVRFAPLVAHPCCFYANNSQHITARHMTHWVFTYQIVTFNSSKNFVQKWLLNLFSARRSFLQSWQFHDGIPFSELCNGQRAVSAYSSDP